MATGTSALIGKTDIDVKEYGKPIFVADDPRARLMYYLDSLCSLLDISREESPRKLRNYGNYKSLTEEETDALVAICFLLSPDELEGKVIFNNPRMCGDSDNKFFELKAVRSHLLVSDSVVIGGQRRSVRKIMTYIPSWLEHQWIKPMRAMAPRLDRMTAAQRRREAERSRCSVM